MKPRKEKIQLGRRAGNLGINVTPHVVEEVWQLARRGVDFI